MVAAQLYDERANLPHLDGVKTHCRLVEDDQRGPMDDGLGRYRHAAGYPLERLPMRRWPTSLKPQRALASPSALARRRPGQTT